MTKARIERVGFIGWRGMQGCEVISLHNDLTGLIGDGGAGKSTLMIALDYAILPDRSSLDIVPVSDLHDSHSAGIDSLAGRIDQRYGYAYVVLDITTRTNHRLVAGVHAEIVDGRASFNRWLIKQLPQEISLKDLMQVVDGDDVYYPDFKDLKRHLATRGIDVTNCRQIGEYGQVLYEAGILPSAMTSAADRKLYAKLIEATFRGGISQEVATRLKEYLLPAPTQIQELVNGLQECTFEVLKTRNAVADADRQLALLESTYGVGKVAVLTALRGINDDASASKETVALLTSTIGNTGTTILQLTDTTIPGLTEEIKVAKESKENGRKNIVLQIKEAEEKQQRAQERHSQAQQKLKDATADLNRFNSGQKLWASIAGPRLANATFEQVKASLATDLEQANRAIFRIDEEIKTLKEEDDRLANERASNAAEHLADVIGGQTLEQALGGVSEREAVVLELSLGGLVDGVVGVDIDALSDIEPSAEMPEVFWLGQQIPEARQVRETGNWIVTTAAGGYLVTSKTKQPVFGAEARKLRRKAIENEIEVLQERRKTKVGHVQGVNGKQEDLLKNHEAINYYLLNRGNVLQINDAHRAAKHQFEQTFNEHKIAKDAVIELQNKIYGIDQPHDEKIQGLEGRLRDSEQKLKELNAEVMVHKKSLDTETSRSNALEDELQSVASLLDRQHEPFLAEAALIEIPEKNVVGLQAKRIADLAKTLGDEADTLESFKNVNPENRVSIIKIWPDLMNIVRETINTDLADSDGSNLLQRMRSHRGSLDGELRTWESELGIKAKNIHMSISSAVRGQQSKISKLSKIGQAIEFGNVVGIRIKLIQRKNLIDILEQFADQLSLFSKEKTVDQVLKEFFDAKLDTNIKLSGEELLDYRNYVDLVIEVRRKGGEWELASSLSGTETIGGGLAIALMLIRSLAARGEASSGIKTSEISTLFAIDEVSRLNEAGQRLLVDFARRENFQLVVTAPTMKPVYDCTLYALSRLYDPHEHLVIRGLKYRESVPELAA